MTTNNAVFAPWITLNTFLETASTLSTRNASYKISMETSFNARGVGEGE